MDRDVADEAARIQAMKPGDIPVRVCGLGKSYGKIRAVDNLSFGLEFGECFALLGVSGAGKTTTF
jgi:ABC-type multidrug transport system ATPase subunit